MSVDIKRVNDILDKGDFKSQVSDEAQLALESSIVLRQKYKSKNTKNLTLDFKEVNRVSIAKRGNLKVYQNLPRGIRVVAR